MIFAEGRSAIEWGQGVGRRPLKIGNFCVTLCMLELRYYLASDGGSPFEEWFSGLDAAAAAKVAVALARLEQGNLSNVKGVGEGVLEYRIDWGPGYRVYFGRDGDVLVILLTGGTKQRQQRDIETAKATWADYKRRRPRRDDTGGGHGTDKELQGTGATPRGATIPISPKRCCAKASTRC